MTEKRIIEIMVKSMNEKRNRKEMKVLNIKW